jgi:hypothetical protein
VQEAAEAVAAPDVAAARQFELRHELAMPAQQRCRCHDEPMLAPVRQQARKRSDEARPAGRTPLLASQDRSTIAGGQATTRGRRMSRLRSFAHRVRKLVRGSSERRAR